VADKVLIYTDGGSRGNPGPGAGAFVMTDETGTKLGGKGYFLKHTTNNIAEYTGMLKGLEAAKKLGFKKVSAVSDSQLMVRQLNGEYRVKSDNLKGIYSQCMSLLEDFDQWEVGHVYREKNVDADKLANVAMDKKKDVVKPGTLTVKPDKSKQKPLRLGILLSGGGTTMVNIQKEIDAGNLNAEIVVVISSLSTVRGVDLAKSMGLDLKIVRKKDFADIESFSSKIEEIIKQANVDLVVQAGWLCLWHIPDGFENRVMNIHPALLPAFGGQGMWGHHVHEAVIKNGCKISGCTVHFCTNEYDKGAIIVQRCCDVMDDDDASSLAARVFEQECIAYPEAIRLYSEGRLVVKDGVVKVKSS